MKPENRKRVLSIIIDGMDQNHSRIPYHGNQSQFSNPLSQGITGALAHGFGVGLYRTLETVSKGADLTIYCILTEINKFYEINGAYPEELYVQVDGGSENANKYVLACLEYLIHKRVVREAVFTRNPAGHTHDDIDGVFGVIWQWFKNKPCETITAYKDEVLKAFADSKLNVTMNDVYLVPNYIALFEPCIDKKLSRLHKEEDTQHQWRFVAVETSAYFPLGCKTMYRAYCSDKVIELKKKDKSDCISFIGRITGLEPITVNVKWHPQADPNDLRRPNIEGFFLLHSLPNISKNDCNPITKLPFLVKPRPISKDAKKNIDDTIKSVRNYYEVNDPNLEDWNKWYNNYAIHIPTVVSEDERYDATLTFLKKATKATKNCNLYTLPLSTVFDTDTALRPIWVKNLNSSILGKVGESSDLFTFPTDMVSEAMNSVVCEWNPHPPEPRRAISDSIEWTERKNLYSRSSGAYYSNLKSNKWLIKDLCNLLGRRCTRNGGTIPTNG